MFDSEIASVPETQSDIDYWRKTLHNEGILVVTATFPEGDHQIGNTVINSKGLNAGYQSFLISKSSSFSNFSYSSGSGNLESEILEKTQKEGRDQYPEGTDFIAISDYSKPSYPSERLNQIENMIGVLHLTKSTNSNEFESSGVYTTMLFPRKYLKELLQQIQKDPTIIRKITELEMPELDVLNTRQKANKIILSVNAKGHKALFPTKINKTFPI